MTGFVGNVCYYNDVYPVMVAVTVVNSHVEYSKVI